MRLAFTEFQTQAAAKDEAQAVAQKVLAEWKQREEATKSRKGDKSTIHCDENKTAVSEITDYYQNEDSNKTCFNCNIECNAVETIESMLAYIMGVADDQTSPSVQEEIEEKKRKRSSSRSKKSSKDAKYKSENVMAM